MWHAGFNNVHDTTFTILELGSTLLNISDELFNVHGFRVEGKALPSIMKMGEGSPLGRKVSGEGVGKLVQCKRALLLVPKICKPFPGIAIQGVPEVPEHVLVCHDCVEPVQCSEKVSFSFECWGAYPLYSPPHLLSFLGKELWAPGFGFPVRIPAVGGVWI